MPGFKVFCPVPRAHMAKGNVTFSHGYNEINDPKVALDVLASPGVLKFDPRDAVALIGEKSVIDAGYVLPGIAPVKKQESISVAPVLPDFNMMNQDQLVECAEKVKMVYRRNWNRDRMVTELIKAYTDVSHA